MKRLVPVILAAGLSLSCGGDKRTAEAPSQDELEQQFEEYSIAVSAFGLYAGSSKPWPRPDPEHASHEAWREAVLAAPRVTAKELLAGAESLDVHLSWTPKAKELLEGHPDGTWDVIARALHDNGRQGSPDAVVALNLLLNLQRGAIEYSVGP